MNIVQQAPVSFDDTIIAFSSKSDKQLKKMYLLFAAMNSNMLVDTGTLFMKTALKLHLPVKGLIRNTIFEHFCGGETIEDSEDTIRELARFNIGTILDYSVEGEKTEEGFEHTAYEILATIKKAAGNPSIPFAVFKVTGVASSALLEKIQKKEDLSSEERSEFERVCGRIDTICRTAHEHKVRVLIDGEESWIQDTIDVLAYEMMKNYNKEEAIVFNTFQMYRKASLASLKKAFHYAALHEYYLGVKLVRGAYMEKEREVAEKTGQPDPIQPDKDSTDADFNKALSFCLNEKQRISLCCGSHNEYSNYYLTVLMEKHGLRPNDPRIYFSQLYGMSDNISYNLAKAGYNVAKYVPYGPIAAVMPYLFRRAEENTSISGQSSREFKLIYNEIKRREQASKNGA